MEESTMNGADFRAARRELRGAMRGLAEGKVLAVIPMSSGGEIRVSVFAERGRPPLVSIGLYHRAGGGLYPRREARVVAGRVVPLPVAILHPDCRLAADGDVGRLGVPR